MITTQRIENFKDFVANIQAIDTFDKFKDVQIKINKAGLFNTVGLLSKKEKNITIQVNNEDLRSCVSTERIKDIEAEIEGSRFIIDSLFVNTNQVNGNSDGLFFSSECSVHLIRSYEFNTVSPSKFRCFIKTDLDNISTFHYQFETVTHQDCVSRYNFDCLRVNINSSYFDIVQLKLNDIGYFVIENSEDLDFETFNSYCFSIRQALGFISSYMPGGEEYFFDADNNYFYSNYFRSSINSMYRPLNWNPHSILHDKPSIAEKWVGKLNFISLEVFSKLVVEIHKSKELSSSIILLLEASSIRSLLLIPSIFAVVIESLSKIISLPEEGLDRPIKDEALAKKILDKFTSELNTESSLIGAEGSLKVQRRIQELNKPVNKKNLTNNEKLTQPFEQLGINLSIDDINAIEHRNDLLHGNILLSDGTERTESEMNNYMGYVSSKLYTLISGLILRHVGYRGYIINHSKFYESACNIETSEDYYRLI